MRKILLSIVPIVFIVVSFLYLYENKTKHEVAYEDVESDQYCFPFDFYIWASEHRREKFLGEELIINNDREYQELLQYRVEENCDQTNNDDSKHRCYAKNRCENVNLPPIDFAQKTLLAKYTIGSCAATGFNKKVIRDDRSKTYTYSIEVKKRFLMRCNGPGLTSMNLITIPKIPENYTIQFRPKPISRNHYVPDGKGGWMKTK